MKKIRYIPYGYTMRNGRTVIAQDEAVVIRGIFSAYINGASLQSIAELLTERKIPYSERTDVWDKARIARIIGNAKYIGDGEYDPIIEEEQYEEAAAVKTARQRNTFEKNLEGLDLLRDLVRCAECGAPMRRRVSSKHRIRESWECANPDCGQRIRISDTHLLEKVTILMNRVIANSYLLIPRPKKRKELSAEAQRINREIDAELERHDPSDALIIVKTIEMAERLYAESDANLQIAASIARKRVSLMTPQEEFSPAYFSDIAAYLTLGSGGKVILHTKTDVEIGDEENECNQDTQENNIGYVDDFSCVINSALRYAMRSEDEESAAVVQYLRRHYQLFDEKTLSVAVADLERELNQPIVTLKQPQVWKELQELFRQRLDELRKESPEGEETHHG